MYKNSAQKSNNGPIPPIASSASENISLIKVMEPNSDT